MTRTAPAMTRREVLEAISGILLGVFVSLLATTIVSTSLPRIVADLEGSQHAYTWVVTAMLLTTTISTPVWGKLADLLDRKALIQVALVVTVVSAAAAGFAQSMGVLIGFRALQGVGAGGLMALATVLMSDIISPRERGRYMGLMGGVMAVAQIGGPLLGGVVTDAFGWRWNFFIGVPFAVAALVVLHKTLHLPARERRTPRIDYVGATLISLGVALLLVWVTFAGDRFAWASWQTAAMVGAAVVALVAAVLVERVAAEPIIPLGLFRNRTFVLSVVASAAVGVAMFGTAVFLSQYLQLSRGKTPTESGLLTIPMVVGTMLAGIVLGRIISATGRYKAIMVGGGVVLVASLLGMSTIGTDTSFVLVSAYLFGLGLSVGALMQNLVLGTQNTLDVREMGAGTAAVAFFRSLGGAIGVSALGAVLAHTVKTDITRGLAEAGVPASAVGASDGAVPDLSRVSDAVRGVVESAYADGITQIFLLAVPMALVALVAVCFLREVPLGERSGIEQLRELQDAGQPTGSSQA
ncbi:MDR family MFS transporter [Isoptericola variabilis]|uniref:Drug resistance transporter, EmrB/QacA subfamily n=1 Tax=Isoptericola variabilis (strain 225) TaxID=743718 RepID=F6FTH6_ISOV2|nr:MDR family MFS transporter [Isoptericola variabilis]AEG43169.1 drug resistance transporter, EmrB/QacA subfamily [Isoptericola variabilis 225]TWH35101.1 EmrB/QacA subfamily drug resistance transporter [Isoptericola variabilis J7]